MNLSSNKKLSGKELKKIIGGEFKDWPLGAQLGVAIPVGLLTIGAFVYIVPRLPQNQNVFLLCAAFNFGIKRYFRRFFVNIFVKNNIKMI